MSSFRTRSLFVILLSFSLLTACGGDDPPLPPPDVDAGHDAGAIDARVDAPLDLGAPDLEGCPDEDGDGSHSVACGGDDCDDADPTRYPGATEVCDDDDEDCNDATFGRDADGDGFESSACCNGVGNCGSDCDDTLNTVNPDASEACNSGIDDDCDGLVDAADGVCVPCPAGYRGVDLDCVNIIECAEFSPCGAASGTVCLDTPGSYVCVCPPGYGAPGTGGTCTDIDECATGTVCGAGSPTCVNLVGTYSCMCDAGYIAPTTGGPCTDVNECATDMRCGTAGTCMNTPGAYVCTCDAGYAAPATGGMCADVDECATGTPCGTGTCTDTPGSYICACGAGYTATGGTCMDVDECATGTPCGAGAGTCSNIGGTYVCACTIAGYVAPPSGGVCRPPRSVWAMWPLPGTPAPGHPFSYTPSSLTVVDNVTGLEWERAVSVSHRNQAASVAYCADLVLDGKSDWRLPTRIELASLLDDGAHDPAIDTSAFPATPNATFWTSSPLAGIAGGGWVVVFESSGAVLGDDDIALTYRARCVR